MLLHRWKALWVEGWLQGKMGNRRDLKYRKSCLNSDREWREGIPCSENSYTALQGSSEKAMAPPLQYSCLEKSHGWRSMVGCSLWGHKESDTTERLHFHFHALEKEMATHSSVLAWRIPGTGEPGGLPSMGSHRVGHDWIDLAAAAARELGNWRKFKALRVRPGRPSCTSESGGRGESCSITEASRCFS